MSCAQTILLVDDSENDRLLMRTAFSKAEISMALQEVHGGIEAIAYLSGDGPYGNRSRFPLPAVMLLDLNMPMQNGFDVLAWVRSQTGLKRLSVIVLSASMHPQDIERAFDIGANSFLVKPASLEGLIEMVRCLREWIGINHYPALTAA
jgi:CheY-like chemotaxis protein